MSRRNRRNRPDLRMLTDAELTWQQQRDAYIAEEAKPNAPMVPLADLRDAQNRIACLEGICRARWSFWGLVSWVLGAAMVGYIIRIITQ